MKNHKAKFTAIFFALAYASSTAFADQAKQYLIDNFKTAKLQGSEVFSQSRTWYSFGGITISADDKNKILHAEGNSPTWSGFGIDPGPIGNNGTPIETKNFNTIVVDIKGSAAGLKLELYNEKYVKYEMWIDLANLSEGVYEERLPPSLKGKRIAKLQFVCAPGEVDITVKSISLK